MATSCNIGILNNDSTVSYIFCHWDGYISGVGQLLKEYYNTEDQIRKLLDLGGISSLGRNLYPNKSRPHTFLDPQPDVTVSYYRDRGDLWSEYAPESCYNADLYGSNCKLDFCYLYDTFDGCWKVWMDDMFVPY